jgi:hypothetical protein
VSARFAHGSDAFAGLLVEEGLVFLFVVFGDAGGGIGGGVC